MKNNFVHSVTSVRKTKRLVPLLLAWFSRNARDLPWRRTRDPYAIWVSEIMLQQTQVKTVVPYWERWLRELPTLQSLAKARPEKIHKLWEGLGYYTRVRNMQKAAQLIVARHDGRFPERFDDVLELPGIGRYTAGAICSIAFHQPTPILDGNVIRVLTRIFGIDENPREKTTNARLWNLAEALVLHASRTSHLTPDPSHLTPDTRPLTPDPSNFNQSLMELGALICTARQPKCTDCPVRRHCLALRQHRVDELPNLGPRMAATARRFAAFVVHSDGRFLVRQRPADVVNAHLWEFPNVELTASENLNRAAHSVLGFEPEQLKPLCTIKHSITRYRITLAAFSVQGNGHASRRNEGRWLSVRDLQKLSFPSAHKKILTTLATGQR